MTTVLDGKTASKTLRLDIANRVSQWVDSSSVQPVLAAVLVGEDPASQVYVRNKEKACEAAGIGSRMFRLPADISQRALLHQIDELNRDDSIHGILVQLPLPPHLETQEILDAISPLKDVDAFHPENVGLLVQDRPRFLPCTPHGVLQVLRLYEIPVAGKHVVIVGRSEIVGKPMGMLLVQKDGPLGPDYANATVTYCHSRSTDLDRQLASADIVVAAVGRPQMIRGEMLKPGVVVIDVGINRTEQGLVGDVDYESAFEVASAITPVPGGIGPLTVTMLLENTLLAARLQQENIVADV